MVPQGIGNNAVEDAELAQLIAEFGVLKGVTDLDLTLYVTDSPALSYWPFALPTAPQSPTVIYCAAFGATPVKLALLGGLSADRN